MIELLAPAGDLEKLKIAFLYGADAVYIGGEKYSLRANAKNFTLDEIEEAVNYAHSLNKKVYVTVNIILHNEDLDELKEYLINLSKIGIDAIIASDLYVLDLIKSENIPLEVHLSTQASVLNQYAAKFYQNYNVKRIVLAREANEEDIKKIKEETNLDLECFIHGAMCTSMSGRCIMSNVLTNRDANRGGCAQVCRWTFNTSNDQVFSMSSKDLNLIPFMQKMIDLGVNSFKIEGRMRGIYYLATIILCYRRMIDKLFNNELTIEDSKYYLKVLNRCANRESAPQFLNKLPDENDQYFLGRVEESNQDFLGLVLDYDEKSKMATIEERNLFKKGDIVEFFGPHMETISYKINKIYDVDNNIILCANHPKMIVKLKVDFLLKKYDMMRIKIDKQA